MCMYICIYTHKEKGTNQPIRKAGPSKAHTGPLLGSGVTVLGSTGFKPEGFGVRLKAYKQGFGGFGV